jgi:hypothetical protein
LLSFDFTLSQNKAALLDDETEATKLHNITTIAERKKWRTISGSRWKEKPLRKETHVNGNGVPNYTNTQMISLVTH